MTIGGSTAAAELASLAPWGDPASRITAAERAGRLDRARARARRAYLLSDSDVTDDSLCARG